MKMPQDDQGGQWDEEEQYHPEAVQHEVDHDVKEFFQHAFRAGQQGPQGHVVGEEGLAEVFDAEKHGDNGHDDSQNGKTHPLIGPDRGEKIYGCGSACTKQRDIQQGGGGRGGSAAQDEQKLKIDESYPYKNRTDGMLPGAIPI